MKIVEVYSHLNAQEYLLVRKPAVWKEIEKIVKGVDATQCRTKISKEKRMQGRQLYSPKDMNSAIKGRFDSCGWEERRVSYWVTRNAQLVKKTMQMEPYDQKRTIEAEGETAIYSYNQTDFVKERVAVEVQFGKYAFVAFDLFVKHLAFFAGDLIDVGVEILPMKELQAQMSSGVAYYEGELYNLVREGRGVPGVPLILIGIAP
jgi:hypothetical protein